MKIKIFGENNHFWAIDIFREKHNAKIIEKDLNGNVINYIVYEIKSDLDLTYLHENKLKYEIIEP